MVNVQRKSDSLGLLRVVIPGEPVAQARARAVGYRRRDGTLGARVYDPAKSRNWKATAQQHMRDAMGGLSPLTGPVRLRVTAYFSCPRSDWRKNPRPERHHTKRPDLDNITKSLFDSANGVIWLDDRQVVQAMITKLIAAQGEAPRVEMSVDEIT